MKDNNKLIFKKLELTNQEKSLKEEQEMKLETELKDHNTTEANDDEDDLIKKQKSVTISKIIENNNIFTQAPLSSSSIEKKQKNKSSLELVWRNLCYQVNNRNNNKTNTSTNTATTKQLIKHLNGTVRSGELTAIIGPSGAGKTTLIECLAGRRITGVSGEIEVNYNGYGYNK